jgi:hypothetical protein
MGCPTDENWARYSAIRHAIWSCYNVTSLSTLQSAGLIFPLVLVLAFHLSVGRKSDWGEWSLVSGTDRVSLQNICVQCWELLTCFESELRMEGGEFRQRSHRPQSYSWNEHMQSSAVAKGWFVRCILEMRNKQVEFGKCFISTIWHSMCIVACFFRKDTVVTLFICLYIHGLCEIMKSSLFLSMEKNVCMYVHQSAFVTAKNYLR